MTGIRHAPSIRSAVAAVVGALLALGFVHDAGGEVGPAFSVPTPLLEAALDCPDEFVNAGERDPVLLVHGLSTTAAEQWSWNYALALPERGYDVCLVTLPDRGFGDQQVSAEYVAHAVLAMQQRTGRHVDLVGHSLGGSMSRWAVRFWPGVRDAIDDFVALGAPHHGTGPFRGEADLPPDLPDEMPAVIWQFLPESQFVTTLDAGDQTPGEVDWTNLYSSDDQSVSPNELSMLDVGLGNPRVANILLQDVCPGREVSHLSLGTADSLVLALVLDALDNDGVADPARLDVAAECARTEPFANPVAELGQLLSAVLDDVRDGQIRPDTHRRADEPPLAAYVTGDGPMIGADDHDVAAEGAAVTGDVPADDTSRAITVGLALAVLGLTVLEHRRMRRG